MTPSHSTPEAEGEPMILPSGIPQGAPPRDHFAEMVERTGPNRLDPYAGSMAQTETMDGEPIGFDATVHDGELVVLLQFYERIEVIRFEDFERVLIEMRGWWNRLRRIYAEEDWSRLDSPPVAVLQRGAEPPVLAHQGGGEG